LMYCYTMAVRWDATSWATAASALPPLPAVSCYSY
jgi:hypothetical protein